MAQHYRPNRPCCPARTTLRYLLKPLRRPPLSPPGVTASIVRVCLGARHDRGRRRLSHVALVLGRGRSQEEVKLGEALGLAYLDAALRKSRPDVGVSLINAIIDPELRGCRDDDLTDARVAARRVAAAGPILCGVSLVYRGQRDWTAAFAAELKQLAPGCHIVVGGMWPTSAWELLLGSIPQVDSICIGEGDRVILRLLDALESGGAWRAIPELAMRGEDGTPVAGGRTAAQLGLRRPPVVARVPAAE